MSCRQVAGWDGFLDAAWTHEGQHFEQVQVEMTKPQNHVYLRVEPVTEQNDVDVVDRLLDIHQAAQTVITAASGVEPMGNRTTTPWWVWVIDTGSRFVSVNTTF